MSSNDSEPRGISVPERFIEPPGHISEAAQAFLSQKFPRPPEPPAADKAAWRAHIVESEAAMSQILARIGEQYPAEIRTHRLSAATLYEVIPATLRASSAGKTLLYVHGGGFTVGGGLAAAEAARSIACLSGLRCYSIDYRMPPDHPFPAGLDDGVEAYRYLLETYPASAIAVYGPSAGGGLAASIILKARDQGLPLPAAAVLHTPEADLTESGDTFATNRHIDVILQYGLPQANALYADGHDLRDPYLSPVFADFGKGFPPTLLSSGTRDLFLSNTVRLHRSLLAAGKLAELHVWEAMPHGGFFGAPEDGEVQAEHVRFLHKYLQL